MYYCAYRIKDQLHVFFIAARLSFEREQQPFSVEKNIRRCDGHQDIWFDPADGLSPGSFSLQPMVPKNKGPWQMVGPWRKHKRLLVVVIFPAPG